MKLLFTQDALSNGGAERSHLEIISRFSDEIEVLFVYFYPKHDLKDDYLGAGIRLIFLDIPESYHFPLAVFRLVKLIRVEKPNLLVSSLWRADIITRIASLITGVPIVGTLVNDSYGPLAWKDKKGLKYKAVYWLDRCTAWIPVRWISNSNSLVDSHSKTLGIDSSKIAVVYRGRRIPISPSTQRSEGKTKQLMQGYSRFNSLDKNESKQTHLASEKAGKDLLFPDNDHQIQPFQSIPDYNTGDCLLDSREPVSFLSSGRSLQSRTNERRERQIFNFVSYGRLLERKGFQDAIQAFSQVLKIYPECTLTIFGEGPFRTELESIIQELEVEGSVFLPGIISNPVDILLYGNCLMPSSKYQVLTFHCFLFPSWYEGFSGSIVEAMMAEIPIIASDIPMNLEAVEDRVSALIFPVRNIEILVESMIWSIRNGDEMHRMASNSRVDAINRFDIEKVSTLYEKQIKEIMLRY